MKLPTLYSRTATGAIQVWTIEIQMNAYRTLHGQHGGKIVTTEWYTTASTTVIVQGVGCFIDPFITMISIHSRG
jgi:hypothetical protein